MRKLNLLFVVLSLSVFVQVFAAPAKDSDFTRRNYAEEQLIKVRNAIWGELGNSSPSLERIDDLEKQFETLKKTYANAGGNFLFSKKSPFNGSVLAINSQISTLRQREKPESSGDSYGSSEPKTCEGLINTELARFSPKETLENGGAVLPADQVLNQRGLPLDKEHPLWFSLELVSKHANRGVSQPTRPTKIRRFGKNLDVYYRGDRLVGYSVATPGGENKTILFDQNCSVKKIISQDGAINYITADTCRVLPSLEGLLAQTDDDDFTDFYFRCLEQKGHRRGNNCFCPGSQDPLNPWQSSCVSPAKERSVTPREKVSNAIRATGGLLGYVHSRSFGVAKRACSEYSTQLSPADSENPGGNKDGTPVER